MADLAKFIPTVQIEGEIVTEPHRTFVTRVFYSRVLMKVAPFALAVFWFLYHPSIIGKVVGLALILVLVPIFLPRLSGLGSLGGGLFRAGGSMISALWQMLDGIVGPNKGQVPVVIFNVQTVDKPGGPTLETSGGTAKCPNASCGHENAADSTFCVSCGTTLQRQSRNGSSNGPRRYAVRIEGQIVGGEPHVGHRVSIHAFNKEGNLLFMSGKDETTGAAILVRRNADTGKQH